MITSAVLILTFVGLLSGTYYGLIRGRERALSRLVLIIISAVLAFMLRNTAVDAVMNLEFEGATLLDTVTKLFQETSIPQVLQNMIFALVEILLGIVSYLILLLAFRLATWVLPFPILNYIIKKVEHHRANKLLSKRAADAAAKLNKEVALYLAEDELANHSDDEESDELPEEITFDYQTKFSRRERKAVIKKHPLAGAVVGLVQGALLAYLLFAPLTGLLVQVGQITSMKINGEPIVALPEEIDIVEYTESDIGKFYSATGGWYYDLMSSSADADGNTVNLDETVKSATIIMEIVDVTTSFSEELDALQNEEVTPEEAISTINSLGDKFIAIGDSVNELGDESVGIIRDLISEIGGENVSEDDLNEITEYITPEFFVQVGNGFKAFAEYEQIKLDGENITAEQASDIVSKMHACTSNFEFEEFTEVREQDKPIFRSAIDGMEDASEEDKASLYTLFGIKSSETP